MKTLFNKPLLPSLVHVVLGLIWGDEGKGKITEGLISFFDLIVRFQGGPNAGHNTTVGPLHQLPCGIISNITKNLIANDSVVDIKKLIAEIDCYKINLFWIKKNLIISKKAVIITPVHVLLDKYNELKLGGDSVGSTLSGISGAYSSATKRETVRAGDILDGSWSRNYNLQKEEFLKIFPQAEEELFEMEQDWILSFSEFCQLNFCECASEIVHQYIKEGKYILAEGAQGMGLDNQFGQEHYVTSSRIGPGAVCNSLGISPHQIGRIIGIVKMFTSKVGNGYFPSILAGSLQLEWCKTHTKEFEENLNLDDIALDPILVTSIRWRLKAGEYGATTKRPRCVGAIDLPMITKNVRLSGTTEIVLTFADFFFEESQYPMCTQYSLFNGEDVKIAPADLRKVTSVNIENFPSWKSGTIGLGIPDNLQNVVNYIEDHINPYLNWQVKVTAVSYGKDVNAVCSLS